MLIYVFSVVLIEGNHRTFEREGNHSQVKDEVIIDVGMFVDFLAIYRV